MISLWIVLWVGWDPVTFVKALNPLSLDDVVRYAKLQEDAVEALKLANKPATIKPPILSSFKSTLKLLAQLLPLLVIGEVMLELTTKVLNLLG